MTTLGTDAVTLEVCITVLNARCDSARHYRRALKEEQSEKERKQAHKGRFTPFADVLGMYGRNSGMEHASSRDAILVGCTLTAVA